MTTKILIVDDDEIVRLALEAYLVGEGYELHFAVDGAKACERARALRPDLILLDVMMPDIDGFAVCRLIRSDPTIGRIPIILITALDDDASRLEGLRAGADEFVTKPCRRSELIARVRTIAALNRFRIISEQRSRFAQLYAVIPLAIVQVDARGVVLSANPGAEALLTPTPPRPLEGATITELFESPSADLIGAGIGAALAGRPHEPCEVRGNWGAPQRVMQLRATAVPDGDRHIALLVFDDVTIEVRAREALQQHNADLEKKVRARTTQLEEANTLLMSYASFLSHELRSPLTVIKGYLALMEEGVVPMTGEAAPLIRHAMAAAKTMEDSIQNILQLARDEHAGRARRPVAPVDPMPTVHRLVEHLRSSALDRRTRFAIGPLPRIRASAVVLERVLSNLLSNAAKFSTAAAAPCVEIGAVAHSQGPVIYVRDNGVGFDPTEGEKLFRDFSRLSTAAKTDGVGLGLAFVARLIAAHGGRIWAEGQPGAGATFFVLFPEHSPATAGAPGLS
jgi:signal transduction histidine kinase